MSTPITRRIEARLDTLRHAVNARWLTGATAAAVLSMQVTAHEGAKGIVKERMDMMSGMSDSMKAMTDMIKRKAPFDPAAVEQMAKEMESHAGRITELFPDTHESRNEHDSYALPAIWNSWEEFEAVASRLAADSGQLAQVAATGDEPATRKQIVVTAKTCKSCHTDYRKPKD